MTSLLTMGDEEREGDSGMKAIIWPSFVCVFVCMPIACILFYAVFSTISSIIAVITPHIPDMDSRMLLPRLLPPGARAAHERFRTHDISDDCPRCHPFLPIHQPLPLTAPAQLLC